MALSLSNFLYAIHLLILLPSVDAATRVFDWEVSWVSRSPDGQHARPVIGINGQWPLPRLEADVGDRVVVNMRNNLGNASTTIHFHGLYMNGTAHMDGVSQGTQCPVPPGSNFTYDFNVRCRNYSQPPSDFDRSRNPAPTGTILMSTASIRTDSEAHSSSMIQRIPMLIALMRS